MAELSTLPARIRWSAGSAAAGRCPPEWVAGVVCCEKQLRFVANCCFGLIVGWGRPAAWAPGLGEERAKLGRMYPRWLAKDVSCQRPGASQVLAAERQLG